MSESSALVQSQVDDIETLDVQDQDWWRQAVVYQIYPRSFFDGNGDGLGDLAGVIAKTDYLVELGVDCVWLSPFYPSELADGGYDVADYRDVAQQLGSLETFDEMITALHAAGIKVVVDIVPNHTSDQHVWFQEALASEKDSPARQRYIFRDGIEGPDGATHPPSQWPAAFGGTVWEQVPDGQYYMHSFALEQPDLNWNNPEVRAEFLDILRFWSDRGVDGFRIDVAQMLAKDLEVIMGDDLPTAEELYAMPKDGTHPLEDRDEVQEIYATWRDVFNEYDPPRVAVAEAWVMDPARRYRYASPNGLGQSFNFDLLRADYDAPTFKSIIEENLHEAKKQGASITWVLSNHDVIRHATRYGLGDEQEDEPHTGSLWLLNGGKRAEVDLERGERRARAASMLLLGLPGATYIYQGEELGLHEHGELADADRQDPTFFRNPGVDVGRDGCRVPLPWTADAEAGFGFGSPQPHMPQPHWFANHAVEVEDQNPDSTLNLYRRALHLRRQLLAEESLHWEDSQSEDVLQFVRPNGWRVVTNFGSTPYPLPEGTVVLSSSHLDEGMLPADTTVWMI